MGAARAPVSQGAETRCPQALTSPLTVSEVKVPLGDGRDMRTALAVPVSSVDRRGMVVLHESFGLNEDIRRLTAHWAEAGYVSVAPDLYSPGHRAICLTRVMMAMVSGMTSPVLGLIDAAREHLARRDDVDAERIGVVGYCQGGGFALAVATNGRFKAAGVNYGAVPKKRERLEGVCPVVASYGGLDRIMGSHGERLERHLESLGVPHDVKTYGDAGHSFFSLDNEPAWLARLPLPDPLHVGHVASAAEDGWRRSLAFFDEHIPRAGR
jgi:carboxymethylenebutenolidase